MMVAGTGAWDEANLNFATTLQKSDYTYDSVGNITTIADSMWGETQTFGYDSLNRLTSATATDGLADYNETYQYDPATGNLVNKNGLVLNYPTDGTRPHAVTSAGSNTYGYDNNGNQTTRIIGGQTVQMGYDAENRLVTVTGTNLSAQFTYNGDGQRVKSVINGEITLFIGGYYERKGNEITKYYFAGASRIAMRKVIIPHSIALTYFLGDHLGSTSLAVDASTGEVIETRYKPWGEVRFTTEDLTLPTRYTYTGQYSYISDSATDLAASASFGLMFYNARWYDVQLGRFAQADTIIPQSQGVQAWDRYAYTNNNPVNYTDPSGHCIGLVSCFLTAIGVIPDYRGVIIAMNFVNTDNALVAAGIAVQSEWLGPWDVGHYSTNHHFGYAQTNSDEMETLGVEGYSMWPSAAVQVMERRIDNVSKMCSRCKSGVDFLIVAALAQNEFAPSAFKDVLKDPNAPDDARSKLDWGSFLDNYGNNTSQQGDANLRQSLSDMPYQTYFMIKLFIQDLRILLSYGYELPDGITEEDILWVEENILSNYEDSEEMQ